MQKLTAQERKKRVEGLVYQFLEVYNLTGEGFSGTPERVARMWETFFTPQEFKVTICPMDNTSKWIRFKGHVAWSFCPHHLLPVRYEVTVGYIHTGGRVLGASKPLRMVDEVMRAMPLQEDIPELVCKMLKLSIATKGTCCFVQGEHACMRTRGVKSPCSNMGTIFYDGQFEDCSSLRHEFLTL